MDDKCFYKTVYFFLHAGAEGIPIAKVRYSPTMVREGVVCIFNFDVSAYKPEIVQAFRVGMASLCAGKSMNPSAAKFFVEI